MVTYAQRVSIKNPHKNPQLLGLYGIQEGTKTINRPGTRNFYRNPVVLDFPNREFKTRPSVHEMTVFFKCVST